MLKGIDISAHQGEINLRALKSQVDFVILRVGVTGYGSLKTISKDKMFERNYNLCKELGIPVGAYYYSLAVTENEAKKEAQAVLSWIKGKQFEYPIFWDSESCPNMSKYHNVTVMNCGKNQLTKVGIAFLETLENAGYFVGIYAGKYWLKTNLNDSLLKPYAHWIPQWADKCTYEGEFGMWQYTDSLRLKGHSGNVDGNIAYVDYPSIIKKEGLNGFKKVEIPVESEKKPIKEMSTYHKVVKGDNLTKIAKKHKTTVSAILKLNPNIKNANLIVVGQKIRVK